MDMAKMLQNIILMEPRIKLSKKPIKEMEVRP